MAAQSLALAFYTAQTALSHELPWPLPDLFAGIANLIIHRRHGRRLENRYALHAPSATDWGHVGVVLDPATFSFFIGGLVLMALTAWQELPKGRRWSAWIRGLRIFTLIIIAWLPVRAALLIAIYMYRVLRADPDRALYVMNHFFSPWPLLILLAVPVLLVWRFLRVKDVKASVIKPADGMQRATALITPIDIARIIPCQ